MNNLMPKVQNPEFIAIWTKSNRLPRQDPYFERFTSNQYLLYELIQNRMQFMIYMGNICVIVCIPFRWGRNYKFREMRKMSFTFLKKHAAGLRFSTQTGVYGVDNQIVLTSVIVPRHQAIQNAASAQSLHNNRAG